MALKIFEALNNIQGKRGRFGYTLTSTVDVMNSLQAAQMQFEGLQGGGGRLQGGTGGDFLSIGSDGGGDLVSNALSGYFDSEGFVNNGYLAQVAVHGYGAFVVTKRTDDGEKSAVVPVEIGDDDMQDGIDCDCTPRFLANVNLDYNQYKEKNFVYGFAIDVRCFGVPFFNKYYPSLNMDDNKLSWLMYERCLCATIKFNNSSKTVYFMGKNMSYVFYGRTVVIDNKYTFRLHTDRIVIFSNTKEFTSFTVECSEKEMKELYDIIEAAN